VRFADAGFLLGLFPALLTVFYLLIGIGSVGPRVWRVALVAASLVLLTGAVVFIGGQPFPELILATASGTLVLAFLIERTRTRAPLISRLLLATTVTGNLATFIVIRWLTPPTLEPLSAGIVTLLGIALAFDVFRGDASTDQPLTAAIALLPLPLLVAGPIVRYKDFRAQLKQPLIGMGPFTYGVRRFVTGLLKILLIANVLARPVDVIFTRPEARLTMDAAWLGVLLFSLQLYFQLSGWTDMAIGIGRMLGLRFAENFRRPYTAESVRDFWRRWNITLMTALRDYVHLPIAGRENPTARLFLNLVLSFCLMGLWHAWGWMVVLWGVYAAAWLAAEETGLGARVARLPRALRHVYVLLVVGVGWALLRAESVPAAISFLETLVGLNWASGFTAHLYLTTGISLALLTAIVGAGPQIPSISRWRVSVDAATVAIILMVGATGIFLWRGVTALRPTRVRR